MLGAGSVEKVKDDKVGDHCSSLPGKVGRSVELGLLRLELMRHDTTSV